MRNSLGKTACKSTFSGLKKYCTTKLAPKIKIIEIVFQECLIIEK